MFYLLTGFGHQAVMIFFVLSGFLIGKNVSELASSGRWSLADYAIRRVSRLFVVLLPALILTALWDEIGIHWLHSPFYSGQLTELFNIGPAPEDVPRAYSAAAFLGNLLFLQTIAVPSFGTNTPLWSLAYEGWYYVLFPAFYFAIRPVYSVTQRALRAAGALIICLLLPLTIVLYGLVWLMGWGVFSIARDRSRFLSMNKWLLIGMGAVFFTAALAISKLPQLPLLAKDITLGTAFSCLMLGVLRLPLPQWLSAGSRFLANFSYTLYLVHFPFLAFVTSLLLLNQRAEPSIGAAVTFVLMFGITTAYACLIYLLFERHTPVVQAQVRTWLSRARPIGIGGITR
jgi:peptidoglycan/LPS O-acetylase OafA/YrhL